MTYSACNFDPSDNRNRFFYQYLGRKHPGVKVRRLFTVATLLHVSRACGFTCMGKHLVARLQRDLKQRSADCQDARSATS